MHVALSLQVTRKAGGQGPMGAGSPGVCAVQDLQMQCQSRSAGRSAQAHLSKMPSIPPPLPPCSQSSLRNVLSHVDLFLLHPTGAAASLPGTNILPAKALTPMWLNHPRIRTQTSWRKSLPPLLHSFLNTWSWPMKGPCRPLPARHELWLDLPLCRWAFQS